MSASIKRFSNLFITHNGQKIITSVAIADYFGKQHKSVLKAIRNLLSEMPDPEFGKLNFMPGSYLDEQNKQQPQYCLTRNGATLLAMGFTGKNATELCLSLLQEFKAMNKQVAALAEPRDEFGFPVNVRLIGQYPSCTCHELATLDESIFSSFSGNNHAELSKKYNLSVRGVYKALARYRNQQDKVINQLVNAIGAGKPIMPDEARELLLSAEPMLYQHTLTQLRHKLSILNLCNEHGRGKRHD